MLFSFLPKFSEKKALNVENLKNPLSTTRFERTTNSTALRNALFLFATPDRAVNEKRQITNEFIRLYAEILLINNLKRIIRIFKLYYLFDTVIPNLKKYYGILFIESKHTILTNKVLSDLQLSIQIFSMQPRRRLWTTEWPGPCPLCWVGRRSI
jgi:hypothetical protein